MDGGSAENAGSNFSPTAMARIVPTILLHSLHPWRSDVEARKMQGAVSARPSLDIRRTAIPGSLRNTTHMDVGSADIAGANISPLHPWT